MYNALAGGGALAAPYAFATTDPNVGVAKVPTSASRSWRDEPLEERGADERAVHRHRRPRRGGEQGEGLGNRFLAGIREVDAIVFVLRAFTDPTCPGPPTRSSTSGDRGRAAPSPTSRPREAGRQARKAARADKPSPTRWPSSTGRRGARRGHADLPVGVPCERARGPATVLPPHQQARARHGERRRGRLERVDDDLAPVAAALGGAGRGHRRVRPARGRGGAARPGSAGRCSRRSGSARARCPASSMPRRTTCSACARSSPRARRRPGPGRSSRVEGAAGAGVIHTDFERGFIRAEVIHWDELLAAGSWSKARDAGQGPARRGQGLRGRRRRRHGDPLQRLIRFRREVRTWPGWLPTTRCWRRRDRRRVPLAARDCSAGTGSRRPGDRGCRSVHSFGMRFPIDVAFCDADGRVLHIVTRSPATHHPTVRRARWVIEAEAGTFAHSRSAVGRQLEIRR
jgi:ribosome-binding ATPase